MSNHRHNPSLQKLLVHMARSLVQYVAECWPWTDVEAEEERRAIDRIVDRQQRQIAGLAELLSKRSPLVEFGTYPTEFTDLHYVALDFLLDQLIADEKNLIGELESTSAVCGDDAEASTLLQRILSEELENVAAIEQLAKSRPAASAI